MNFLSGFADISLLQILLVAAVALFASVIGGLAGYGTGALMPLVLVPMVGAEPVVPIIAISSIFTNSSRFVAFVRFADRRKAIIVIAAALFSTALGAYGYTRLTSAGASLVIGGMKRLEAVAGGVAKRDQATHPPAICERLRLRGHRDAGALQPCRQRVEGRTVGHLPAEEPCAFALGAVDHDALLAVVHPEREQRIAALDCLQPDEASAELPPVVERVGAEASISETQNRHLRLRHLSVFWAASRPPFQQILRGFPPLQTPKMPPKGRPALGQGCQAIP